MARGDCARGPRQPDGLARDAAFIGSSEHLNEADVHAFCRWRIAKVTDNPLNYNFSAASGLRARAARCIACRHKLLADTQSGVLPWPDGHKLTRFRPNLPLSDAFSLDCLFRVAT